AVLDLIAKMLPELAKQVAGPLGNIDKITVIDSSGSEGSGASKVSNYVTNLMAQTPEMVKQVSGIDLNQLIQGLIAQQSQNRKPPASPE
ncbi:MAG: flotillin family protein, partial [Thermoactinomyces sp.]